MNSEVCILFGELSGLPLEERERYYAAHSTPEETRREVESLLSFGTGPIIEHIVQAAVRAAFQEPLSDGDSCGPFRSSALSAAAEWVSCISPREWMGKCGNK